MLQHTNVLNNIAVLFILTANLGFAQSDSSCKVQSLEKQEETEKYKIAQAASAKKYITAEYCLNFDTNKEWALHLYETIIPLTINVQSKSANYSSYISMEFIDAGIADINYGSITGVGGSSCIVVGSNGRRYKCEKDRNENYNIYDYFKVLYFFPSPEKTDTAKISTLFDKKISLKWDLDFEIDYQKHNLSGTHNIYISGICTEEQLKKIEYPVNPENPVNRGSDKGQK